MKKYIKNVGVSELKRSFEWQEIWGQKFCKFVQALVLDWK